MNWAYRASPGLQHHPTPSACLRALQASKLNLVDLAGSERVSKTRSEGSVLREAGYINKSLSFLEQVGGGGPRVDCAPMHHCMRAMCSR
jgi:hypothetical protein